MKLKKLTTLIAALGVGFILSNPVTAQAATITYQTDFAPFLPSVFNPNDTFDLGFQIHDPQRPKPIVIKKIRYHVLKITQDAIIKISIPLYFVNLSQDSFSNFTSPLVPAPPDGIDLTLSGLGGYGITNSFIPFNFGITRSDVLAGNLSFELETDDLVSGDGIVASLRLNGSSIGSLVAEPIPEPSTIIGLGTIFGFSVLFKRKLKAYQAA
jgi:hypothetical protein